MNWEGNKGKFHVITIKKFVKLISISFSVPKSRVIITQKCGFEFVRVMMVFLKNSNKRASHQHDCKQGTFIFSFSHEYYY